MAGVVQTIGDRCKRCYHCVRHCPAKAVRVVDGQAQVVEERCIACGNCVRVCAQGAKEIEDGTASVRAFLGQGGEVIAALAPSFPAAFYPLRPGQLISALRVLGFTRVVEVAFGADLVARRYSELVARAGKGPLLASPCPALVYYVEKFAPPLVHGLAPVVSPMVALGRALKQKHWPGARIVFIGPCIAKKKELRDPEVAGAIDAALTFSETRDLLETAGIDLAGQADGEFDPPRAALGRVFPVSGGLLRTAAIQSDVLDSDILVTDGMLAVQRIIDELQEGKIHVRMADLLLCEGCINGPVMPAEIGPFARRQLVTSYVSQNARLEPEQAQPYLATYDDVDLSRTFEADPVEARMPTEDELQAVLERVHKFGPEDELNCGACGYDTCREKAIAVCRGLAEVEMCLPYLIEEMERALQSLASTQGKLVQAEKLATMGQLAAGVAHQVNNPLGTVLLYGHMMLREMTKSDARYEDLQTIVAEATRCKTIVADLLDFARQNRVNLKPFEMNTLLEGILELAAKANARKTSIVKRFDTNLPQMTADPEQLSQAFLNVIENSLEAMSEGGTLTVTTEREEDDLVRIEFADTGSGIDAEVLPHIFDPFFTTKPMGQGTGLGLAIAKGIIKVHSGDITAVNRSGGGASFVITLPLAGRPEERLEGMIG